LKIIRKGFADYPVHPEGTDRFVQELQHALEDPVAAQTYIDSRIEIDQNYLTRLFVGQVSIDLAEGAAPQVEDRWRAQVADTEVGAWLLQHRQDSQDRMLNLASKDPESKRYLLVDSSGIKVMETDLNDLAQQFAANTLAALDDRKLPVVDRAVQRILSKTYNSIDQQISCDELTGLVNRRAFERMLNDLLHADPSASSHVLIMLDVDQFGLVNDLCGFEGGDRLLQSITNLLHNYLPLNGQLARTGDDEFAILVNECSLDQGFQIAETQRQSIDEYRYSWANQLIPVSASVGVVGFSGSERTSGDLLKAASSACSIAKQAGRNCTRVYREDDQAFMEHKQLIKSVASVEDALARDRFVLVAQCIEPLQKGTARSHYEILLRVLDENDVLQGPFHFINAAEKYDLMRSVDRWVVRRFFTMANAQAAGLGEIGGFSINLSGQSIADDEFKQFLIKQIEASPLPRDRLGFEITETVMVKDQRDAVRFIEAIRAMGCSFYLDDFGSGYASFSSLKELPVDYVKIDGIFIKDLLQDRASQTMVKSVTEIAHFMGRQVIAEFVENQQTADALRVIGVDFIQGYHIGRPVPLHEILRTDTLCSNCS
jgi:diguanylate cyclase (GGDEF)-like protein